MNGRIGEDLAEVKKKLGEYVNKGRVVGYREVRKEPVIAVKPDKSRIKPLRKMKRCDVQFLAVDCSTRTLKRANNWGVYLLRTAYASVKARDVSWGYEERIRPVIGDTRTRYRFLEDARVELESMMALNLLREGGEVDYLLLDGASYFGGERKFRTFLYEKCEGDGINLIAISKQSPTLHDDMGRDFVAATYGLSPYAMWVYHPVIEANIRKHLYGNVSIVKLCEDSPRVFRCDIMKYLLREGGEVHELLSPLISISEDPRCLGYPVALWLAHDFSAPSESKLLHYYDQVEETLADAGLLDVLRIEELSCNFPDELHGVKHPFEREWIEHV
ncbi:MAG: DNA double-strand break repair nuclease NurA [Candidatus Bathyarchaeia archaeon]